MRSSRRTSRPLLPGLLLLAAVVLAGFLLAPGVLLALAPAFLLFATLLTGALPGEELLHRLRTRFQARAPRRRRARVRGYRAVYVRRTGRLIAAALAVRPPPAGPHTAVS